MLQNYFEEVEQAHAAIQTVDGNMHSVSTQRDNAQARIRSYVDTILREQFLSIVCDGNPDFPPEHRELDHRIELVPGAKPPVGRT